MSRPKGQQFPHRCTAWANGREKSTGLRRTLSDYLAEESKEGLGGTTKQIESLIAINPIVRPIFRIVDAVLTNVSRRILESVVVRGHGLKVEQSPQKLDVVQPTLPLHGLQFEAVDYILPSYLRDVTSLPPSCAGFDRRDNLHGDPVLDERLSDRLQARFNELLDRLAFTPGARVLPRWNGKIYRPTSVRLKSQ